jgi:hypothetical protein
MKFFTFIPQGLARALFAVKDGEVVGGNIASLYKGGSAFYGGVLRREYSGNASRLLMDAQIVWARESGGEFFETGQAYMSGDNSAFSGISDFKQSFGAVLHPLFQGSIITRPRTHAALQLMEALRRQK